MDTQAFWAISSTDNHTLGSKRRLRSSSTLPLLRKSRRRGMRRRSDTNSYVHAATTSIGTCSLLLSLPNELLTEVAAGMSPCSLAHLASTCSAMRAFCADDFVWRRSFAEWFGDEQRSSHSALEAASSSPRLTSTLALPPMCIRVAGHTSTSVWRQRCAESMRALRACFTTALCGDPSEPHDWAHFTAAQRREGLQRVVCAGHHALLRRLLAAGAFDRCAQSRTDLGAAVFWACAGGSVRCLRMLLCHCTEWDSFTDQRGFGALSHAARHGHARVVHALLDAGADPLTTHGSTGHSVLWLAAARGHTLVVEALLGAGADPASLANGCSALEVAAQEGHVKVVRLLLDALLRTHRELYVHAHAVPSHHCQEKQPQQPQQQQPQQQPQQPQQQPQHHQRVHRQPHVHLQQEEWGVCRAAESAAYAPPMRVSGRVLHCAANRGQVDVVRHLLGDRALHLEISHAWGERGVTPLFLACVNGSVPLARLLVQAGANVELGLLCNGVTPLFAAASRGHMEVCCVLLDAGASAKSPLFSPMLVAQQNGHLDVAELLCVRRATRVPVPALPLAGSSSNASASFVLYWSCVYV
jgi:ankyrin repeat protein